MPARRELNGDKARWAVLHCREASQPAVNQYRPHVGMDFEQLGHARRQLDDRFTRELLGPCAHVIAMLIANITRQSVPVR